MPKLYFNPYKNILANKFMADTNYIIIKDTNNLEELEKNWELFNTHMTNRQKLKSDDRSVEIWNMTNQQHYDELKRALLQDTEDNRFYPDPDAETPEDRLFDVDKSEDVDSEEISDMFFNSNEDDEEFDRFILQDSEEDSESVEEGIIPISNPTDSVHKQLGKDIYTLDKILYQERDKNRQADQWEIDNNINIIGGLHGNTSNPQSMMDDLEKQYHEYMSQRRELRKKSDDECIRVYGMSNVDRYNYLKPIIQRDLDQHNLGNRKDLGGDTNVGKSNDSETLIKVSESIEGLGGFVQERIDARKAITEANENKLAQKYRHRPFKDTPYFSPDEMIDMGVYSNSNFYSNDPDNDGLVQGTQLPIWFDDYKSMCMDHIFEDHRKEWIDTVTKLYEDFEQIKESGDIDRILSRKQSILELGWNPEVAFTPENRIKASNRLNKILESIPKDVYVSLNDIPDSAVSVQETAVPEKYQPVYLIFTEGKTPIVSKGIKLVTGSKYSHISIGFGEEGRTLKKVYSFNRDGFISENRESFLDNNISVMAFYVPDDMYDRMMSMVGDFNKYDTKFDIRIFRNKLFHVDRMPSDDIGKQVCSTFIDTVLRNFDIVLTNKNIPDPGQLYASCKRSPNKVVEVYTGPVQEYDPKVAGRKLHTLLKQGKIDGMEESVNTKPTIDILNEVKRFPVEFDKDGNLIIYKCRSGNVSYEDEIRDTVKLLENYRNTNDIEGIKYEMARLWFIIDSIEKELKKKSLQNDKYKSLVDSRSVAINVFKQHFEWIAKAEKGFNFSEYYNSTPFSDSSTKISATTIKYAIQTIKAIVSPIK